MLGPHTRENETPAKAIAATIALSIVTEIRTRLPAGAETHTETVTERVIAAGATVLAAVAVLAEASRISDK